MLSKRDFQQATQSLVERANDNLVPPVSRFPSMCFPTLARVNPFVLTFLAVLTFILQLLNDQIG